MIQLKISLQDGSFLITNTDLYDPVALAEAINARDITVVVIGDLVVNRNTIKSVVQYVEGV